MKKTMLIVALMVVAATIKAENGRSTSTLLVSVFDSKPLTVMINGSEFQGKNRVLVTGLHPGRHKVKVTREYKVYGHRGEKGFVKTLYDGWVKVPYRSKVTAKVTKNRSVQTQVVQIRGRRPAQTQPQHHDSHTHYGAQACTQTCPAYVFECTSGQPVYDSSTYTGGASGVMDYPHGPPLEHDDSGQTQVSSEGGSTYYGEWDHEPLTESQGDGFPLEQTLPLGMDDARFDQLLSNVQEAGFESTRFEIAKHTLQNEALSTAQTIKVLRLFEFENSKIQLAKMAYDHVVDPENYLNVTSEFTFSSSTSELIEYMNA